MYTYSLEFFKPDGTRAFAVMIEDRSPMGAIEKAFKLPRVNALDDLPGCRMTIDNIGAL